MNDLAVQNKSILDELPPEWPQPLLDDIRQEIGQTDRKVVILDDDPTGTQTSKNIPILTEWSVASLENELRGDAPAFFVLTNSRSMSPSEACALARDIGDNLLIACRRTGKTVEVISRSDSTLRGHYPEEVTVLAEALQQETLPHLIIPFFLEGGRYTLNNIHYVMEKEDLVPAAQTPFAKDAAFGFSNSDLRLWIQEKTSGKVPAEQVVAISVEDIRLGGPEKVADILLSVAEGGVCIVNSVSYRDMETVTMALFRAAQNGRNFLARTAASFVRTRLGQDFADSFLGRKELITKSDNGGLFVVGSYVEKTTIQLQRLLEAGFIEGLELNAEKLLEPAAMKTEISRLKDTLNVMLAAGRDVAVFTSRKLVSADSVEESLRIGNLVSSSLIEVVQGLKVQPRYLVAKGGITSSDMATKGLQVKRAMVIGQVQPGVPVWRLGKESAYPGMAYIVYPGNVGGENGLAELSTLLKS